MNSGIERNDFQTLQSMSSALYKSGYFSDVKSEAQAIVKVMAGAELGLPPFASMTGIHIINNKPALGSNVIATLVKNDSRYDYKVIKADHQSCVLAWFENGKPAGESGFTMDEAAAAGLISNPSWKKFPSDMLFARAMTRGARRFAPGIFGGSPIYTPEELGVDTDEDGYIDATHTIVHATVITPKMSLETAEDITNRDGVRYGDLETDKLSYMANSIVKVIAKNGLSVEEKEEHQMKLDAINIILSSRNGEE